MLKLTSLFILISIFIVSCAPVTAPTKQKCFYDVTVPKGTYYFVNKGDSLWRISRKYGISVEELIQENNISSPRDLKVGQKLFIPRRRTFSKGIFLWPVNGEVVNFFGESVNNLVNRGLNIKTSSDNRKVSASAQGRVVFSSELKGWGKTIIMKHDSNFYTLYANLDNALIKEGSFAKKGQVIGDVLAGKDGNYVLHFEIRKKYLPEDPIRYLN